MTDPELPEVWEDKESGCWRYRLGAHGGAAHSRDAAFFFAGWWTGRRLLAAQTLGVVEGRLDLVLRK